MTFSWVTIQQRNEFYILPVKQPERQQADITGVRLNSLRWQISLIMARQLQLKSLQTAFFIRHKLMII